LQDLDNSRSRKYCIDEPQCAINHSLDNNNFELCPDKIVIDSNITVFYHWESEQLRLDTTDHNIRLYLGCKIFILKEERKEEFILGFLFLTNLGIFIGVEVFDQVSYLFLFIDYENDLKIARTYDEVCLFMNFEDINFRLPSSSDRMSLFVGIDDYLIKTCDIHYEMSQVYVIYI
jgi:hypothetical protein